VIPGLVFCASCGRRVLNQHKGRARAVAMALSSMIMNTRKTDMSEDEFYAFERQLDNKSSGGVFDPKAVKLE